MKKILLSIFLSMCLLTTGVAPALAVQDDYPATDYVDGIFDWMYLSNSERRDRVTTIFKIMFPKGYVSNFPKNFLKSKLKAHLKDRNFAAHYEAVCSGRMHYRDVDLQPFVNEKNYVYMYALQFTKNPQRTFYYDALGNLKFIDFRYGSFPECPFYTKKYSIDGKLIRAMYMQNPETMYIYSETGSFIGVKNNNQVYSFNY